MEVTKYQSTLADKHVWIIDDEISKVLARPDAAHMKDDLMVEGLRPVDRGTLRRLTELGDWSDPYVEALCKQLVAEAGEVTAFFQPDSAVSVLRQGRAIPDIIVYDLVFDNLPSGTDVLAYLEDLLNCCVSIVQVYAQEPERLERRLKDLQAKFATRMQPPRRKIDITAANLVGALDQKWQESLSARLAGDIRRLSSTAIEDALVRIDDLPLNHVVKLLTTEDEDALPEEKVSGTEFVELLSVRLGDAIRSAPEVAGAIGQFMHDGGVAADKVPQLVGELVSLLAAQVRQHIQYEDVINQTIESAWQTTHSTDGSDGEADVREKVREFFGFRLYDQPGDDLVRTGDLVVLTFDDDYLSEGPDLYMVLTPPCDLARFWKNTRGFLTLAKLRPMTSDRGVQRLGKYADSRPSQLGHVSSITAREPMVFPSVPLSEGGWGDYLLHVYEIRSIELDGTGLWNPGLGVQKKARFSRHLTYSGLQKIGKKIERKCRISEPFLGGVLGGLRDRLFRFGVPDFPQQEKERLLSLFRS